MAGYRYGSAGWAGVWLAAAGLTAHPAGAQSPPASGQIENLVVTAQKRSQKVQDIPITINVLDAARLRQLNVQSSDQLDGLVPALEIGMPSGKGNQPLINIRGVGLNDTNTNNAGPNGVYVDEVYEATPAGQTFQTFDLARVEVLKGPQGTLYGRNTTGGAIDYVTNKPTEAFEASEDVQYGSWNSVSSLTTINGLIAPHIDARAAVDYSYSDGYFSDLTDGNKTNGDNSLAYRAQVKADVTDDLTLLFNVHGGNVNRRPDEYKNVGELNGPFGALCSNNQILAGACTDAYGYKAPGSFYKGFYDRNRNLYINAIGGSVRADWKLDGVSLTSLTAYETSHKLHPEDSDADPHQLLEINYGVRSTDITQEFHASGGGTRYHWLAGLYGLVEHLQQDQPISIFADVDQVFGAPGAGDGFAETARTLNGQFTQSAAIFGQGDVELFPGARLTLGGRLTYEHKAFDAFSEASFEANGAFPAQTPLYNIAENLADRGASYKASFDYKLTRNVMTYAGVSTGFKSGGFNGGFLANDVPEALAQLRPIKPEYLTDYEIGEKADFFDNRLRLNTAAFYYSYRDLQTYNIIQSPLAATGGSLPLSVLTNAPTATIKGAEFEVDAAPLANLSTSLTMSYVDAYLGQFVSGAGSGPPQVLTGKELPNSPRFTVILQGDYKIPLQSGTVDLFSSLNYRSHQFFESNNNPLVAQDGYWILNARVAYTTADKRWEVAAIGKNLTGQKYLNFSNDLTSGFGLLEEIVGAPRYVGGEVVYHY
jgi:iron complex outermembrane receptor protein